MKDASEKFAQTLEECTINDAKIPVYTNVDAKATTLATEIKPKMVEQIYSSVMWTQTIENMVAQGIDTIIEIGPGKVLAGLVKKINPTINVLNIFDTESLNAVVEALK